MITEDYASYKLSLKLREKGFDEYCLTAYSGNVSDFVCVSPIKNSDICEWSVYIVTCPTLQMVMKWIREKYNIEVVVSVGLVGQEKRKTYYWTPVICRENGLDYPVSYPDGSADTPAETWGDAVSECVEYILDNLI